MVGKRGKEAETTREWVALFVFGLSFLGGSTLLFWLESACFGLSAFGQLLETIDAAGGIDKLLLAGVERMTGRAELNMQVGLGGPGVELVPAGTVHVGQLIFGVDVCLHMTIVKDWSNRDGLRSGPSIEPALSAFSA